MIGHSRRATSAACRLAGRHEEAADRLARALEGFHELHAASFERETEARLAEAAVLAGDFEDSWRRAGEALEQSARVTCTHLRTLLERLRGWSLLGAGDAEGARSCLEESLAIAREADADYEVALTLRALAVLDRFVGDADRAEEHAGESEALLARLGVVAAVHPPAGPPAGPAQRAVPQPCPGSDPGRGSSGRGRAYAGSSASRAPRARRTSAPPAASRSRTRTTAAQKSRRRILVERRIYASTGTPSPAAGT